MTRKRVCVLLVLIMLLVTISAACTELAASTSDATEAPSAEPTAALLPPTEAPHTIPQTVETPSPTRKSSIPTLPPPVEPTPRVSLQPLPTKPPPTPHNPVPSGYPVLPDDSMAPQLPLAELKNGQGGFEFMNIPWASSLEDVEQTLGMSLFYSPGSGNPRDGDQYIAQTLYQYDPYRVITKFLFSDDQMIAVNFTFLSRYGEQLDSNEANNLLYHLLDALTETYGNAGEADLSSFTEANPKLKIYLWEATEQEGNIMQLWYSESSKKGFLYLELYLDMYLP